MERLEFNPGLFLCRRCYALEASKENAERSVPSFETALSRVLSSKSGLRQPHTPPVKGCLTADMRVLEDSTAEEHKLQAEREQQTSSMFNQGKSSRKVARRIPAAKFLGVQGARRAFNGFSAAAGFLPTFNGAQETKYISQIRNETGEKSSPGGISWGGYTKKHSTRERYKVDASVAPIKRRLRLTRTFSTLYKRLQKLKCGFTRRGCTSVTERAVRGKLRPLRRLERVSKS